MGIITRIIQVLSWTFISALGIPLAVTLLIVCALVYGFWLVEPHEPDVGSEREEAAEIIAEEAAKAIAANTNFANRYVRVARLGGDEDDALRDKLNTALPPATECTIVPDNLMRASWDEAIKRLAQIGLISARRADEWQMQAVYTLAEAVEKAQNTDVDYLVYGDVEEFRIDEEGVHAAVELAVANPSMREPVWSETITHAPTSPADKQQSSISAVHPASSPGEPGNPLMRTLFWVGCIFLLPLVTIRLSYRCLQAESNKMNFIALASLTMAALLLTWFVLDISFGALTSWLVLAIGTAIGFFWSLVVLNALEEQRKGSSAPR